MKSLHPAALMGLTVMTLALALALAPAQSAGAGDSVGRDRPFGEGIGLCVKFDQGQPAEHLELLPQLGARWVRDHTNWSRIEPEPGQYAFPRALRERLAFYRRHGIGVVFCLLYDNKAAYPPTDEEPNRNIDPEAYGRFAVAAARLLQEAEVEFVLELWNEPHNFVLGRQLGGPWHGGPPSPWLDHYVKMVHEAVRQVKAFDRTVKVLSDEDCTIIHYNMLEAGLPAALDGIAFHPYMSQTVRIPELSKEGRGAAWEGGFTLTDPDHSFRSMVRRLREEATAKLGKTPELWITEIGCPVQEDVTENVTFSLGSGTEEEVAAILVRAFIGAEAAGVEATTWFSFWDGPDGPMGLMARDGRRRKAYDALQTLSAQLGPYTLRRQVAGFDRPTTGTQAYLFQKGDARKVVAWAIEASGASGAPGDDDDARDVPGAPDDDDDDARDVPGARVALTGALRDAQATDIFGNAIAAQTDADGTRWLPLGFSPLYLAPVQGDETLETCFR